MEKGSLRFDVNVSVRPAGSSELRTRTELKNMNSFAFAANGIEREVERQIAIYEAGGTVEQETLHFDPGHESAPPLRSKEEAQDYRYFPEPDLVPLRPDAEVVERIRGELGERPGDRIRRLEGEVGFELAEDLVANGRDGLYASVPGDDRRAVANVLKNQLAGAGVDVARVHARELGRLIEARDRIPRSAFVEALARSADDGFSADGYLEQDAVSSADELVPVVKRVIAGNEAQVAAYRGGKTGLLGFFVGRVMQETGGKADARTVNQLLRERLEPVIEEANDVLVTLGYSEAQLCVRAAPLPRKGPAEGQQDPQPVLRPGGDRALGGRKLRAGDHRARAPAADAARAARVPGGPHAVTLAPARTTAPPSPYGEGATR